MVRRMSDKETVNISNRDYLYQCAECDAFFPQPTMVTKFKPSAAAFYAMCPECRKPLTFEKKIDGEVDFRKQGQNHLFQCGECLKFFDEPKTVLRMKLGYAAERIVCPDCKKALTKEKRLAGFLPNETIPNRVFGNLNV